MQNSCSGFKISGRHSARESCYIAEYDYNELLSIDIEDVKIVKAIEDLYQKIVEAQEKAFGPIVKQPLKKD